MPNLVGIGLSQVPTNSMLGGLAYQDPEHASIKDLDLKNFSQINSEIADTAVDIFVYDTSKDSDGGAWRKRTTHTSWYNETLGTATRGTRREFPAVAVIVRETGYLTIYDGDDPDLPMWMVFEANNGNNTSYLLEYYTTGGTSVTALNGIIVSGHNTNGATTINFISEKSVRYRAASASGTYDILESIKDRNTLATIDFSPYSNTIGLVNSATNDVAMTVLPNAPIDSATGLPVPTIAAATDGGTSIIRDDGTIIDISPYSDDYVAFDNNNLIIGRGDGSAIVYAGPIPNADISETSWRAQSDVTYFGAPTAANIDVYTSTYDPGNLTEVTKNAFSFDSSIGKVVKFDLNTTDANSTMVAYAATSYNTGWMHGDTKGAFLSDTDTTNLSGGNKVTNGDSWSGAQSSQSSTAPTGWTGGNGATWKTETGNGANGTYIRLYNENNGGAGPNSYMYQAITTVAGKKYKISLTQIHHATISVYYRVGTSINGSELTSKSFNSSSSNTPRYLQETFTATGTTTYISLGIISGTHNYGVGWDDVIVTEVDEDRSANANGLHSYGTITKSAVATGADLVAYSNFSTSNYLEQPYNSDLDFGTGDFSITCWFKPTGSVATADTLFYRGIEAETGGRILLAYLPSGGSAGLAFYANSGSWGNQATTSGVLLNNVWHHIVAQRKGNVLQIYLNGVLSDDTESNTENITNTSAFTRIGYRSSTNDQTLIGYISLFRISGTAPSAAQVKKMYEDERFLFQENAACTLYGSSDAVTALAYDEVTEQLHVGTSSGRSDFQGLRRINNTTTAVTTAISAHDEFIVEQ